MDLRFFRKTLATVSAIAIAFTAIIIPSTPVVSAQGVPAWAAPYVQALFDLGVVDSTGDAYRSGDTVNRAELAAMVYRAGGFDPIDDDPAFSDVSSSDWFYTPVATLKAWGVIQGRTPTSYDPSAPVNRAEAMKIITLAFDILASDGADVPFSDVNGADWYHEFVAAAYENSIVDGQGGGSSFDPAGPITRAAMAKLLGLSLVVADSAEGEYARVDGVSAFAGLSDSELVALITGGEVVAPPVSASNSSLSVSLAPGTPAAGNIPANGFNVDYTNLTFTAGTQEGAKITGLTVTRTGLGNAGNFNRVKLYIGSAQVGNEKTFNSQHNTATFNLSSSPIMVPAGSSVTVRILGDHINQGSGFSNQLGIASAAHVTAVGANAGGAITASGNFGVFGNAQTTTGALVGTMTYEVTDPHGTTATQFYIGETDRVMTRINISTSTEDMDFTSITFRNEGSANSQDAGNFTLWRGGQIVAGPVQMNDRYITFDLPTPLFIERGNSMNFEVHGDIFGGFNRTIGLDIYRDWHIMAVGRIYGYPANVAETGAGTVTVDNITGTRTSFAVGPWNPTTGDVPPNARDASFLQFNVINNGDAITIRNLPLAIRPAGGAIANDVSDVKIWRLDDEGNRLNVVAGPVEPVGAIINTDVKVVVTDEFEVEENVTAHFLVTADIDSAVAVGETFDIDVINADGTGLAAGLLATSGFEVKNISTNDIIYNNAASPAVTFISLNASGNIRTANNPTITVTTSTSPATDVFVKNATNVAVVGYDVRAGSSLDVELTSLTATLTQHTTGVVRGVTCAAGAVASTDLNNVRLYSVDNGAETLLDGPRTVANGSVSFTGFTFPVIAGDTAKLIIRADISSAATNNICPTFRIDTNSNITANDSNGRALTAVNASGNTNATGNQILSTDVNGDGATTGAGSPTVYPLAAVSGKLQITVNNDTPAARQIISGTNDVEFTRLKLQANSVEDVKVERLRLFNATAGTTSAIKKVKLFINDQEVANGTLVAQGDGTGYVTWENLNIVIPKDDSVILSIRGDVNTSQSIVNIAGQAPRFVVRNLEDNWVDNSAAGIPDAVGAESATTASNNGDVKAVGIQSGVELVNVNGAATDAIAGDRGFDDGAGVVENLCDSAGLLSGAVETAPAEGDTCTVSGTLTTGFTFSGNQAKAQTVLNTRLSLALASNNPTGSQGAATGTEEDIFRFTVSAAANATAQNPRQASVNFIYLTVNGDAEANSFALFGPSNNYTSSIATAAVNHRTTTDGGTQTTASDHASITSVVVFDLEGLSDSLVDFGSSKTYLVKANVFAVSDNDKPTRSLRPSIANYGTSSAGLSDVVWDDNGLALDDTGAATVNTNSKRMYWIDDAAGKTKLEPSTPLSYTGSSFIASAAGAPSMLWARSRTATTVDVYTNEPMTAAGGGGGDFSIVPNDGTATDDASPTASANVVTLTNAAGNWGATGAPTGLVADEDLDSVTYGGTTDVQSLDTSADLTGATTDATSVSGF